MLTLSTRHQLIIGLGLAVLMVVTRGHFFTSLVNLPGASWAVFFLAGVYLHPALVLPGLLALVWTLDFAAFKWGGVSGYCLTPAYGFLLPAYGALWLAGRWYAKQYHFAWENLLPLVAAVFVGALVCELFSSGGFYFFSGRFADTSFTEFGGRLVTFFPSYLGTMSLYVGIAAMIHVLLVIVRGTADHNKTVAG